MYITEFIKDHYPIRDKLVNMLSNPYTKVANNDDLPYDIIDYDESGQMTKLVEVEEDRYVSVIDLISMSREDIVARDDLALLNVWDNYMSMIDIHDVNIADIFECVRAHDLVKGKREEQLSVLSLQEK